jgi:trans-aconitate methyltransferase
MQQIWNPDRYQQQHAFVWQLGQDLLGLLKLQVGERVLDLGCGTGQLAKALAEQGMAVIGMDADPAMIATAQQNYPDLSFQVADARTFALPKPVDAVFSNAVLHWIPEADQVAARVWASLKPGGRFVAEFGGRGNVQQMLTALHHARTHLGYGSKPMAPWYFPSVGEYATVLEHQGFEVRLAELFDRPTPLVGEDGMVNWFRMFAGKEFSDLIPEQQTVLLNTAAEGVRSRLYQDDQWMADYRRLRILAVKPQGSP